MQRLFWGLIVIAAMGCGYPAEENATELPSALDTISVAPVPYDPDPLDTIPADQYLIHASSAKTAELVRSFLQNELKADIEKGLIDSVSRQFVFFEYDLNDDSNKETFVGLFGSYFCGSGGCTLYLLNNGGVTITRFTVAGMPVIIDNNKSNGWKDLFIRSGGNFRILKFDGKSYPSNPSLQPTPENLPGDGLPRALDIMNDLYPKFRF